MWIFSYLILTTLSRHLYQGPLPLNTHLHEWSDIEVLLLTGNGLEKYLFQKPHLLIQRLLLSNPDIFKHKSNILSATSSRNKILTMFLQWQRFDVNWSIKSKNLGQSGGFLAQSPYLRLFIMFATETSVDNFCVALQHFMVLEKHHLLRCHCSCEVFSAGSGRDERKVTSRNWI